MDPLISLFSRLGDEDEGTNSRDTCKGKPRKCHRQNQGNKNILKHSDLYLPPECADGNIEYKLKLINPSRTRFEHLVTQMKWRLREGLFALVFPGSPLKIS